MNIFIETIFLRSISGYEITEVKGRTLKYYQIVSKETTCNAEDRLQCRTLSCNAGDPGSIPRLGRTPGEGNGNPLQYSCLGNPMDRGAWWLIVHGVAKGSYMT